MFGISWKPSAAGRTPLTARSLKDLLPLGDPVTRHSHRLPSAWERLSLMYIGRLLSTKDVTKDHG